MNAPERSETSLAPANVDNLWIVLAVKALRAKKEKDHDHPKTGRDPRQPSRA